MQVWRLNIKTAAREYVDPRKFCFDRNVIGIGWPIDTASTEVDWDEYCQKGKKRYQEERQDRGWWRALNALYNRMSINDLVWARDNKGKYWLARVLGEWRYEDSPENRSADILNVRKCNWREVGTVDAVPGRVAGSFSRGGTLVAIPDKTVLAYSAQLYDDLVGESVYIGKLVPSFEENSLFSLLSDSACEDLVGTYLQIEEGYGIVPSSCKRSTLYYEFVMKHKQTGERAVAQVKGGTASLDISKYAELPVEHIYLFTARGEYLGSENSKVHCLEPTDMERFARENPKLMTEEIARWLKVT